MAEDIDVVIADMQHALIAKQANVLLDGNAHLLLLLLRKVVAAVRAAEKFDANVADLFRHLNDDFANTRSSGEDAGGPPPRRRIPRLTATPRARASKPCGLPVDERGSKNQPGRADGGTIAGPPMLPSPLSPLTDTLLVGRDEELRTLTESILLAKAGLHPVVVTGPGGSGKTALVAAFARQHAEAFPGGYVHVSANAVSHDDRALIEVLTEQLQLVPAETDTGARVAARLRAPRTLVHIDDVDSRSAALAVAALPRSLKGCSLIASGRFEPLGASAGWNAIRLGRLSEEAAMELLGRFSGTADLSLERSELASLVSSLAASPMALRLAAGLLARGTTVSKLVAAIGEARLDDSQPPSSGRNVRTAIERLLADAFGEMSKRLGDQAERLLVGLRSFAHAPPSGTGTKLGAALAGLTEEEFETLARCAEGLEIVQSDSHAEEAGGAVRWRIHPLVAEMLRKDDERDTVIDRITQWFIHAFAKSDDGWADVHRELPALAWWLGIVPQKDWPAVVEAGGDLGLIAGPFSAWMEFCERALKETTEDGRRISLLRFLAGVAQGAGNSDRASVAAEEMRELATRLGLDRERAIAWTLIADIHGGRGRTAEAARILQEQVLPALDHATDVDNRMAVVAKLSDLLERDQHYDRALGLLERLRDYYTLRGESRALGATLLRIARVKRLQWRIDDALSTAREAVAIFAGTGLARDTAAAWLEIADALLAKGERSGALDIYREQVMPALRGAGDNVGMVHLQSRMADVLKHMGQREEALRLLTEEVVPALEQLGDWRAVATEKLRIGNILRERGEQSSAKAVYLDALVLFKESGDFKGVANVTRNVARLQESIGEVVEALKSWDLVIEFERQGGNEHDLAIAFAGLAKALENQDKNDEALRVYREEVVPRLEHSGDMKSLAAARGNMAQLLSSAGETRLALDILRSQVRPYFVEVNDEHQVAWVDACVADSLARLGEVDEAIRIYEAGVSPIVEKTGTPAEQVAATANLGGLYAKAGEYSRAIELLRRSAAICARLAAPEQIRVLEKLGRLLLRRNAPDDRAEAHGFLFEALEAARSSSSPRQTVIHQLLRNPIVERLQIRNFKNIQELTIDFCSTSELAGQWTCIAGINGAGKSAVLQAIALVLLGDERAQDIGSQWLDRARRRVDDTPHDAEIRATLRVGEERRELALHIYERGIHRDIVANEPSYPEMKKFWVEREEEHLLLSFGPGRNLSERLDTSHADKAPEVRRQLTLFDPLTQVSSAEWLIESSAESRSFLPLLRALLATLFKDTPISLDPDRSTLGFRIGGAKVSPVDLPDGFRATIAWLAEICAVWCKKCPEEAKDADPSSIRGIVLVDEIDVHLHPSLQRLLVPRLRLALPEVQWIVTTHSPLVLGSFDRREIVALEADTERGVRLRAPLDRQILGFKADEIYRWLMGVTPRSAAIDTNLGQGAEGHARKMLLLAQSPTVSEKEAKQNREYRRSLLEKRREEAPRNGAKPTSNG